MSALRLSHPGRPTVLVDQGPASPHRPRGYVPGGVLVIAESERARNLRTGRAWNEANRERVRETKAASRARRAA